MEQLLRVTTQVLEFLGQSRQNVAVLHCLDGRSNTAMVFAGLLMAARVFSGHREALALFQVGIQVDKYINLDLNSNN